MPDPLPLPIRVLVKGASTVGWASPMGGPRTDFTFPRVIEQQLLQAGRPVEIRTHSVPSERTKSTLLHWEDEVIGFSPDVVILVYGHYETVHLFLPWWLERHANSLKKRSRPIRNAYRRHVLRPVWMFLAKLQARADVALDPTMRRSRPRRVAADLEALIEHIQELHSPLVFLFELLPPAKRYQSWFPGMAARIEVMNEAIGGLVARLDNPNVRYKRIRRIVEEHAGGDLNVATPDGFHFSADIHRIIGTELAEEIREWADTQAHLQVADAAKPIARKRTAKAAEKAS
jgi:GDSL-like Lipase/Acylhydrolase family